MSFDSIIGQPLAVDLCRTWLKQKTTNPLLFYGPEGVGKKKLALEVAKALNCPAKPLEGCGQCVSCRKIAAGNHPDVRVIDMAWQAARRREDLEKQQNLRIETILDERHRLLQSPAEGTWKVSIVEDAHRLTEDAANVLLKILEEPPAHTAIFLLTPFRDRLMATLVSRCQPVRFRPLTDGEIGQCLRQLGIPSSLHVPLAELALGSPGRAVHLNREEQIESLQEAERLWQALETLPPSRLIHEAAGRPKSAKPHRQEIEQHIQSLLVPAARALRSGDPTAAEPVRLIQSALTQLRHNVQPGLVYDNLLLQLSMSRGKNVIARRPSYAS
jgi:DNA polymerase III delta' subunit